MDEAEKMNLMVKKLLTLNQLESGGETVTMERFELTELVVGVLQASGILLEQNGITITEYPRSWSMSGRMSLWSRRLSQIT